MDLIVRNAHLSQAPEAAPVDIGVSSGHIAAIEPSLQADGPVFDAGGSLVCGGRGTAT
jgi:cytosine/creatinine deaminase